MVFLKAEGVVLESVHGPFETGWGGGSSGGRRGPFHPSSQECVAQVQTPRAIDGRFHKTGEDLTPWRQLSGLGNAQTLPITLNLRRPIGRKVPDRPGFQCYNLKRCVH